MSTEPPSEEVAAALVGAMATLSVSGDGDEGAEGPGGGEGAETLVAGLDAAMNALRELVAWPITFAEEAAALGVRWPTGLLLHGPPGCGKTLLVRAVARESGAVLHRLDAGSVFGSYAGESERAVRDAFDRARKNADQGKAVVLFIDELDTLCPQRSAHRQHEARVVAQLLTLMDGANAPAPPAGAGAGAPRGHLVVVAATNRPDAVDRALRRPGRFDREVAVTVPGPTERAAILRVHAHALPLATDVSLEAVATACHGYTGADLAALCREAAMAAIVHHAHAVPASAPAATMQVSSAHFAAARAKVGASVVRGAAVEAVRTSWDDVGGLGGVKARLRQAVEWPLHHAAAFSRLGITPPRGVLLHGPPGCSKTTLVRAAATASGATLLPLSGAELFSMYVGEGEAALRATFQRARLAAPSIIFLDEVDGLASRRQSGGGGVGGGSEAAERLLSTLLTEMDGLEAAEGVLVMGATNRPKAMDAALLRPGRFDVVLYVPPPDEAGRAEALRVHTRRMALQADVDLAAVAACTPHFTGAELESVCREAALAALREDMSIPGVAQRHFQAAAGALQPALTPLKLAAYEAFNAKPPPAPPKLSLSFNI